MRSLLRYIFFLWIFISGKYLFAQLYGENQDIFTTHHGLSNNMILSLHQDHKGFLWIGTYNGLCRYDGKEIRKFHPHTPRDSANWINTIDVITEDRDHNLWISNKGNGISRLDMKTGKWETFKTGRIDVTSIYADQQNIIWLGMREGEIAKIENGKYIRYGRLPEDEKGGFGIVHEIHGRGENELLLVSTSKIFVFNKRTGKGDYVKNKAIPVYRDIEHTFSNGKQVFYFLENKKVVVYDLLAERAATIKEEGINIFHNAVGFTRDKNLLILKEHSLLTIAPHGDIIESINLDEVTGNLQAPGINCVYEDRSGLIWIGTRHGLFKIDRNRTRFRKYTSGAGHTFIKHSYIRSLCAVGNAVWIGTKFGQIGKVTIDTLTGDWVSTRWYDAIVNGVLNDEVTMNAVAVDAEGTTWAGGQEGLYRCGKRGEIFESVPVTDATGKEIETRGTWTIENYSAGKMLIGGDLGVFLYECKSKKVIPMIFSDKASPHVRDVHVSAKQEIWVATSKGLYKARLQEDRFLLDRIPLEGERGEGEKEAWALAEDKHGNIWIATTGSGVYKLENGTGKISRFTKKENELAEDVCSGIIVDKKGKVWISTINGMSLLEPGAGKMINFSEEDGLLSNDFNFKACTITSWGEIYFGSKSGLLAFDPEKIAAQAPFCTNVEITGLRIMGVDYPLYGDSTPSLSLAHQDNNISFRFSLLDFRRPFTHVYRYMLKGFDRQWQSTSQDNPIAAYTNLPPGLYTFMVQASSDGVTWNESRTPLDIEVRSALWQRTYFWVLSGLTVLLLSAFFIRMRFRSSLQRERERSAIQKKMSELEMTALRSQMNPHFIFNAIGGIQHYILKNDIISANEYLARFAKLMRLFLESSRNKYISIEEETNLLELYLSLEKLRFEEKFHYDIAVDQWLLENKIQIPTMLVQPFVENAVQHGLVHKKKGGWLKVSFTCNAERTRIICTVEDNGIGRTAAAHLRQQHKPGHISRGMEIVDERLKTFSEAENIKVTIQIEDKISGDGTAEGTRVNIEILLQNKPYSETHARTYY